MIDTSFQKEEKKKINPFKGPYSYSEDDKDIFFGREDETYQLFKLISLNPITVFYGKSGMGKSSILKAGLIPYLKKTRFVPIYIRPNYANNKENFISFIKQAINNLNVLNESFQVEQIHENETLWEYFNRISLINKSNSKNQCLVPVLIFDQFEEVFTKGKGTNGLFYENILELIDELSCVVEDIIPSKLLNNLNDYDLNFKDNGQKLSCRVVLSLREEFIPQLEAISSEIPSLLNGNNHLRLKSLSYNKAIDILTKAGSDFFDDKAISKVVNIISGYTEQDIARHQGKIGVEPFMLSLFCYEECENLSDNKIIYENDIHPEKLNDIMFNFFKKNTADIPPNLLKFLEERLITEQGNRTLYSWENALQENRTYKKYLLTLIDRRILRKETLASASDLESHLDSNELENHVNSQIYIELIHDKFTEVLKKNRDERRRREFKIQLKEERKKRFKSFLVTIGVVITLIGIFLLPIWMYYKNTLEDINQKNDLLRVQYEKQIYNLELTKYILDSTVSSLSIKNKITNDSLERKNNEKTILAIYNSQVTLDKNLHEKELKYQRERVNNLSELINKSLNEIDQIKGDIIDYRELSIKIQKGLIYDKQLPSDWTEQQPKYENIIKKLENLKKMQQENSKK